MVKKNKIKSLVIEGGTRIKSGLKKCNEENPILTIVTVVYNGQEYIEDTIKSVLKLKNKGIEFIIIDGGSTDNTLSIIRQYDQKIDYWISEKDNGIYHAMNKGTQLATGKAIYLLNCGDFVLESGFNELVSKLPSCFDTHGYKFILYGETTWIGKNPAFKFLPKFMPALGRLPSHQGMIIPRELQLEYPYDETVSINSDQDFKISMYLKGVKYIKSDLVVCRCTTGGLSQEIKTCSSLINKTKQTYYVFNKNYFILWALLYSSFYFVWNSRKLLKHIIKS